MDNFYGASESPRDPDYYARRYPDRLDPPPESAADEIAFAIAEKLLQKELDKTLWEFQTSLDEKRAAAYMKPIITTLGISMIREIKYKCDWMIDGYQMEPAELNAIEDAFEGFIEKVEWENE